MSSAVCAPQPELRGDLQFEPVEFEDDVGVFLYPHAATLLATHLGDAFYVRLYAPLHIPHAEETVIVPPGLYRVRINNGFGGAPLQGRCCELDGG